MCFMHYTLKKNSYRLKKNRLLYSFHGWSFTDVSRNFHRFNISFFNYYKLSRILFSSLYQKHQKTFSLFKFSSCPTTRYFSGKIHQNLFYHSSNVDTTYNPPTYPFLLTIFFIRGTRRERGGKWENVQQENSFG